MGDVMMKRAVVLLVALALALPVAARAQGKPNFSGTWIFDQPKSDPSPAGRGGGGGGGGGGAPDGGRAAAVAAAMAALSTLYVKQTETELTIEGEATYRLDGRESVSRRPNRESKTRASWDGARLVLTSTQTTSNASGKFDVQLKEVWSLAGGALMVERTVSTPGGAAITRKLAYRVHTPTS